MDAGLCSPVRSVLCMLIAGGHWHDQVRQLVEAAGGTLLAWHPAIGTALVASQNTGFPPDAVAKVPCCTILHPSHLCVALLRQQCTCGMLGEQQLSPSQSALGCLFFPFVPTGQPAAERGSDGGRWRGTAGAAAAQRARERARRRAARGAGHGRPGHSSDDVGRLADGAAVVRLGVRVLEFTGSQHG